MNDSDTLQNSSIYSTLLQLPLIKGASMARLTEVVGRLKLHFFKASAGEVVVEPGRTCKSLIFVLSGSVRLSMVSGDGAFAISQTLEAPQLIAPDCLFGLDTSYPCRVEALGATGLMEINKEDFRRMLALDPVFLFNYLNAVCTGSQRGRYGLMAIAGGTALERLAYWITTLTQPGAKDIVVTCSERELHSVLGISVSGMRAAVDKLAPRAVAPDAHTLRVDSRDFLLSLLD